MHFGRLTQQHIHGHVHRRSGAFVGQHQLPLLGGHADDGKGAALTRAHGAKGRQRLGGDGQHIALLALVAPDFFGRHTAFLQGHGAQVKTRAAFGVVGQLRKGIGQAAGTHVMDRQNRIVLGAQEPTLVDDLLRAALDFGVAALHRVKVQFGGIGAGRHRAGRAAAHADAHARAAQLHQQAARQKLLFVRLCRVDHAQTASDHDGLVVAALHGVDVAAGALLEFAEIAQQIGPAKLVIKCSAAQWALSHDVQSAGDVARLAIGCARLRVVPTQLGYGKARQARLRLGAPARGAFVTDFAARARGRTRKGRDSGRVVVRFHLHQDVLQRIGGRVLRRALRAGLGRKALDGPAFHHRRIVRISHQHVLRVGLVGVADHAKHAGALGGAVDAEVGIEDFVAAVLAVGLGEHHEFDVAGVALQLHKGLEQVIDFVIGQGQAKAGVGLLQGAAASAQHVAIVHGRGQQGLEQAGQVAAFAPNAFGHAVMQQGSDSL